MGCGMLNERDQNAAVNLANWSGWSFLVFRLWRVEAVQDRRWSVKRPVALPLKSGLQQTWSSIRFHQILNSGPPLNR